MTAKEALENIKSSLADYREYAIACLPNKAKQIRDENNDDFKIVETALNRLEEQDEVLKIIKEKEVNVYMLQWYFTYSSYEKYVNDFENADYDMPALSDKLLTKEEFNLLKEYLK